MECACLLAGTHCLCSCSAVMRLEECYMVTSYRGRCSAHLVVLDLQHCRLCCNAVQAPALHSPPAASSNSSTPDWFGKGPPAQEPLLGSFDEHQHDADSASPTTPSSRSENSSWAEFLPEVQRQRQPQTRSKPELGYAEPSIASFELVSQVRNLSCKRCS